MKNKKIDDGWRPEGGLRCPKCGHHTIYSRTGPDGYDVFMCRHCGWPNEDSGGGGD